MARENACVCVRLHESRVNVYAIFVEQILIHMTSIPQRMIWKAMHLLADFLFVLLIFVVVSVVIRAFSERKSHSAHLNTLPWHTMKMRSSRRDWFPVSRPNAFTWLCFIR